MNSNGNDKVGVSLSLRQVRVLMRMANRLGAILRDNNAIGYDDQPEGWRVAAQIEAEAKWGLANWAESRGMSFKAGYRLAQKWADESLGGGFGSAFRKGA